MKKTLFLFSCIAIALLIFGVMSAPAFALRASNNAPYLNPSYVGPIPSTDGVRTPSLQASATMWSSESAAPGVFWEMDNGGGRPDPTRGSICVSAILIAAVGVLFVFRRRLYPHLHGAVLHGFGGQDTNSAPGAGNCTMTRRRETHSGYHRWQSTFARWLNAFGISVPAPLTAFGCGASIRA